MVFGEQYMPVDDAPSLTVLLSPALRIRRLRLATCQTLDNTEDWELALAANKTLQVWDQGEMGIMEGEFANAMRHNFSLHRWCRYDRYVESKYVADVDAFVNRNHHMMLAVVDFFCLCRQLRLGVGHLSPFHAGGGNFGRPLLFDVAVHLWHAHVVPSREAAYRTDRESDSFYARALEDGALQFVDDHEQPLCFPLSAHVTLRRLARVFDAAMLGTPTYLQVRSTSCAQIHSQSSCSPVSHRQKVSSTPTRIASAGCARLHTSQCTRWFARRRHRNLSRM